MSPTNANADPPWISVANARRRFHQLLCKQFLAHNDKPNDPDEDVCRAILLPADDDKPVFTWVRFNFEHDDDAREDEGIDFAEDVGLPCFDSKAGLVLPCEEDTIGFGDGEASAHPLVCGMMGCGEFPDHGIMLAVRKDSDTYPPNKCVEQLLGHETASRVHGPALLVRTTKVEHATHALDTDPSDFTLGLDGIVEFAAKPKDDDEDLADRASRPKQVPSVIVNKNIPYYDEVKVLRSNKAFAAGKLSMLSQKMGLPLLTTNCTNNKEPPNTNSSEESPALPVAYLHVCIDTSSPDFGTIPGDIRDSTASTLVISADKNAITSSTLVGLCDFIKDVAQPTLAAASKGSTEQREAAVATVVSMWAGHQEVYMVESDDSEEEDEDEDEEGGFHNAGDFDDLADMRAKMGQMQMTTPDTRTGMGHI